MVQHSGIFELEQILDVPVLHVVEQPEYVHSFFRNSVPAVSEAGYRSAQACSSCLCCSTRGSARAAVGGTVGRSAD